MSQSSLSDQIYKDLKWSLIVGGYRPGETLSIRKLAAKLDVSAMPVREALKRLASERLLISAANKSYRIAVLAPATVSDQFFVRAQLESVATALATHRMSDEQIEDLMGYAEQMERDVSERNSDRYVSDNYNFHFAIYAASGNEELVWSIERLWALTGPFLTEFVRSVDMPPQWQGMHIKIAEAIKARDSDQASRLIEQDISWGTNVFLEMRTNQ